MSKEIQPAEQSIAMRVLCCGLTVIAVCAAFIFGESQVPVIDFSSMQLAVIVGCVWLTVGGAIISWHYREQPPQVMKVLVKVGAGLIILNLARELWLDNLHATQFQFARPLLHALVSAIVVSSFELRTRSDINSCAAFSLCLMALAASSGKSLLFGACVIVYLILGSVLMYYSARSQSVMDHVPNQAVSSYKSRGLSRLPIALAIALLPLTSLAAFSFIPRLDAEADRLSAHLRSSVTSAIYDARRQRQTADQPVSTTIPAQLSKPKRKQQAASKQSSATQAPKTPADKTPAKSPAKATPKANPKPQAKPQPPSSPNTAKSTENKTPNKKPPTETPSTKQDSPLPSDDKPTSKQSGASNGALAPNAMPPKSVEGKQPDTQKPGINTSKKHNGIAKKNSNSPSKPSKTAQRTTKERTSAGSSESSPNKPKPDAEPEIPQKSTRVSKGPAVKDETFSLDEGMTRPEELVFTLACNRSVYTRITTMDKFDGLTWSQRSEKDTWEFVPSSYGISLEDCPSLAYSMALPVMEIAQTYKIEANLGGHIPAAGIPQYLSLLEEVVVDGYGDLNTNPPLLAGTSFNAVSQLPIYSLTEMRRALPVPDNNPAALGVYIEVPDSTDNAVFDLSDKLVVGADNRFAQAENICNYLRKSYKYSSLPMNQADGANLVNAFLLDSKKGDCKAFASAFILLCRTAGIPARFVGGFAPGDLNSATGTTSVRRKHGHAWAEIFMEPYGWIPFDATPNGMLPARPEEKYYNFKQIKREIEQRSKAMETQAFHQVETILTWAGYVLAGAAGLLGLYAVWIWSKSMKNGFKMLVNALKRRHPASKVKTSVMRDLKKIGLMQGKADTSSDLIQRLSETLEKKGAPPCGAELESTFREFLTTYDAVYFGNEEKLTELKRLANDVKRLARIK